MLICSVLYRVFYDVVFILKSQKTFDVFIAYAVIYALLFHISIFWLFWCFSVAFLDFFINFLLFFVRLICLFDCNIEVSQKVHKYRNLAVHDEEDFYS